MGVQDIVTKEYMKDEHRFADVFNYYLFNGEQIVQADKLKEADPVELGIILDGEDSETVQKIRDVLKNALFLTDETCNYLLLGIENQSEVSYETVNLLNVCTNTQLESGDMKGVIDVCKGIDDMKKHAKQEGRDIEFVNAIERIAQNAGGLKEACDLYGTTVDHYQNVKSNLAEY